MFFKKKNNIRKEERKKLLEKERAFNRAKMSFIEDFNNLAYELGLYNKFNKTYRLDIIEEKNYGYIAKIYLATGLNFSDLEKHKATLQQNLKCLLILDYQNNSDCATAKIITKAIDTNIEYSSPNLKAHEMYLGMSYSLESVICNCNKYCMFLLAGATGAGKTRLIYMILLSWILSRESDYINIYISDVAKREFVNFQDIKQVKYYADDIDKLRIMTKYIYTKILYRTNLIEPYRKQGVATNIEEYNKLKGVEKLTYDYVLIDEFSVLMPDKTDGKEGKVKEEILSYLKKISKLGRAMGIFVLMCTQKTTRDEIPAIIKNMSAVRVSFRANDNISSEVIMGNDSAVGLADRIAVYSLNGGNKQDFLFSPKLTTTSLNALLKPFNKPGYPKPNIEKMTEEMELFEKKRVDNGNIVANKNLGVVKSNLDRDRTMVVDNLPYDIILYDENEVKIIEDKKMDFTKTEKPRKKIDDNGVKNGWWLLK